jgi:hypothetical protein
MYSWQPSNITCFGVTLMDDVTAVVDCLHSLEVPQGSAAQYRNHFYVFKSPVLESPA